jgi:hypothetical protein
MPKRHSFSLPKQAHPFTPKKPFTEFNSIPKMSLLQSFLSPNLLLLLLLLSLSLSLSQKCLFKNTHLGTTCSCKKLHFIVVGNSLQMIIKNPTTTPLPPSSLLYYTRPQVSWALGHYITWACENHAGRT